MVRPASPLTWATDVNYASGVDSGTPTKSTPTPAERSQGFIPDVGADAQAFNALLNNYAAWIEHTRLMRDQDWIPIFPPDFVSVALPAAGMKALGFRNFPTIPTSGTSSMYVGAFNDDEIVTSRDGIRWFNAVGDLDASDNGVAHHKALIYSAVAGLWIIGTAASSTNKLYTNPEPATGGWTARTLPGLSSTRYALAESGSIIVLAGDSDFHSSTDGITWADRGNPTTNQQRGVVWSGSLFVSVGDDGQVASSTDGITWTDRSSGVPVALQAINFVDVAFDAGSGKFVAIGTAGKIMTSTDGITWVDKSIDGTVAHNLISVTSDGQDTLYMTSSFDVLRSRDGGDSWSVQRVPGVLSADFFAQYGDGRPILYGAGNHTSLVFGMAHGMRTEIPHANIIP